MNAPPALQAIGATDAALAELARLRERFGPLIVLQSGGCCDGSSPLVVTEGELLVGHGDLLVGELDGTPFYIDAEQYDRWNRPSFLLDVVPGSTGSFSIEALDDVHFVTRTTGCPA
jgi:uncharacterized protein (DUF779 family)